MLPSCWQRFEFFVSLVILAVSLDGVFCRNLRRRSITPPEPKWGGVVNKKMTHDKMLSLWKNRPTKNFWEESGQFEGDIILTGSERRTGVINKAKRWPDGVIPYLFDDGHFSEDEKKLIKSVMEEYHIQTCIKFRPHRKSDADFIIFRSNEPGCKSAVGRKRGRQKINLQPDTCLHFGTIAHELLHAIGFFHQQSASDRDDYVSIKWKNITKGMGHNFQKYSPSSITDFGVGYDFDSVMHYSRKAFSKNGEDTIVPHDPTVEIGQRDGLSKKDIIKANRMYKCNKDGGGGYEKEEKKPYEQ
ncbi:hypothetical protein WDU94_006333 [Cyamophila willieti]